jgi:RNA polymerase sigma-70 factor, ECF subfamily
MRGRSGVTVTANADDRREELARVFADPIAFRRWYDDAVVRVYRYLYGRCGGDSDLAEDITQQTFVQAVRHRQSYDGRADSVTWLCSIARNRLVDHYREIDRQQRRHLRLVVREIPVVEAGTPASVDDREAIISALRDLPALQRAALVLRFVDGLSVREVAVALGRSEDATESLIRRAKDAFRAAYPEASDG